jgi:putative ABC transport system permease protein
VRRWAPELAEPLRGQNLYAASPVALGGVGPVLLAEGLARRLGKTKVHADFAGLAPAEFKPVECRGGTAKDPDANVQLAGASFDGSFNAVDGEVMGLYSTGQSASDESALLTSLETMQSLYATDKVTQVAVFLKDHRRAAEVAARLEAALAAQGVKVDAVAYDHEVANPYYVGTIQLLGVIAGFMTLIVMIVVVLSVLNSMTMTILERTREIGTFRSIGFTRRQVVTLLVREGLVLTGIAIAVGLALGVGAALAVNAAEIYFNPPGVPRPIQLILTPSPSVCVALAAGMLLLCVVATWIATRRRVAMNIVELNTAVAA